MKTIRTLASEVDKEECLEVITILHRNHFFHPGLVLSSTRLKKHYEEIIERIKTTPYKPSEKKLLFKQNIDKTLTLYYNDSEMHQQKPVFEEIINSVIEYPKNITKEGIFLEFLYEYSTLNMRENKL